MVVTGDGELGFDSGEGAWETATTSKEGSPCPVIRVAYAAVALKCLRAGTRPTGSGALYTVSSRCTPPGVMLRPTSACGVSSWHWNVHVLGATKETSLPLLVLDAAHDIVSWPFWLPWPDPRDMLSEFEKTREQVLPLPLHS